MEVEGHPIYIYINEVPLNLIYIYMNKQCRTREACKRNKIYKGKENDKIQANSPIR